MPNQVITSKAKSDFIKLMHGIIRLQNGEVSRILSKMGILYRLNYGVSIPHLRHLVLEYKPNNELAFMLWEKDIRETKILASVLFETDNISFDQALEIGSKINNQELVEQFSKNFFSKLPFLVSLMEVWETGNEWEKMLALYSAGWSTRQHGNAIDLIKDKSYSYIDNLNSSDNNQLHQSLLFVLQSLSMYSEILKIEIDDKAKTLMHSDNCSVRRLGEEYLWLNAN